MFAPRVSKAQTKTAASSTNKLAHHRLALVAQRHSKSEQANQRQAPSLFATPPLPGTIQPKLVVGQVNDPLEHEADRVADQVMRMPAPESSIAAGSQQTKSDGERETTLDGTIPGIVHDVLRSPGQPLDANARAFFEPRFGHDFSQVRIHADGLGAQSAHDVSALAYTAGSHIVFAPGRYAPQTRTGQHLLAHELAHVVQQRLGPVKGTYAGARYPGSVRLQRQPAAPPAQTPQLQAPGLGSLRTADVDDLIKAGDFQGAIDTLVHYKYMDYEIDLSLLADRKMTFDAGLTSSDGATSMPFWDYASTPAKARPPEVRIGPGAFSSVSYLYSVIMHEYKHVLWQQTLAHQNLSHQARGHGGMDTDEVEAYAWELLHATETGLALLPGKIAFIWGHLNDEYWQLDPAAQKTSRPLVMRALEKARGFVKGSQERLDPFSPPPP